jgi:hypothetical protein
MLLESASVVPSFFPDFPFRQVGPFAHADADGGADGFVV